MEKDILSNPKNVKFADLLQVCIRYFGNPRISGSHHIFKTPWQGDPRINVQKDGNMAKEYQVKAVIAAIKKLEDDNAGLLKEEERTKPGRNTAREKKHGKERHD